MKQQLLKVLIGKIHRLCNLNKYFMSESKEEYFIMCLTNSFEIKQKVNYEKLKNLLS